MENILKISSQILLVIGFFVLFIGLLASPIIYINLKQRYYFKNISTKYNFKVVPYKHFIIRDFPYAYGKINEKNAFIEATTTGKYSYNIYFETHNFSNPVIKLGVEFNNPAIKKIVLIQKELFSNLYTSEFDNYFTVKVEPEEFKTKIFNARTKQNIINYSRKSKTYVNLFLENGYLISILNFELTNNKRYNKTIDRFTLMSSISTKNNY